MSNLPQAGVIGTDGQSPLLDPSGIFSTIEKSRVYFGQAGQNKIVPKLDTLVFEYVGSQVTFYKVTSVNPTTMVSTLTPVKESMPGGDLDPDVFLLALGGDARSDLLVAYVNQNTSPARVSLSSVIYVNGINNTHAKLFLGSDVSSTGRIISAIFNQAGEFVTNNIPLVNTNEVDSTVSPGRKFVSDFHTTYPLQNNDLVSLVVYNNAGVPTWRQQLRVEISNAVWTGQTGVRNVVGVRLKSPHLNSPAGDVINVPMGISTESLMFTAVVEYSDGEREINIDNTNAKLLGLEEVLTTIIGADVPVQLQYLLAPDEVSMVAGQGSFAYVSKPYTARIVDPIHDFAFKLFVYPEWVNTATGYRLRWFLYNLRRDMVMDVTQHVSIDAAAGTAFNPKGYGIEQQLLAYLDVGDVMPELASYRYPQWVSVVLNQQGNERGTNWLVGHLRTQSPKYGEGLSARGYVPTTGQWVINLSQGISPNFETWLEKVYTNTRALHNPQEETQAPQPNRFKLIVGDSVTDYPLADWNKPLSVTSTLGNNKTIFIQFYRRLVDTDLQLSTAGLPLWRTDTAGNLL